MVYTEGIRMQLMGIFMIENRVLQKLSGLVVLK